MNTKKPAISSSLTTPPDWQAGPQKGMYTTNYWIVPFAKTNQAPWQVALKQQLLAFVKRDFSLLSRKHTFVLSPNAWSSSHEAARAFLMGWPEQDGYYPWAALDAKANAQIPANSNASYAYLQLGHWTMGMNEVTMTPEHQLQLNEEESMALFNSIKTLFDQADQDLIYCNPNLWLAKGDMFRGLRTAAPCRVQQKSLQNWQDTSEKARQARRLLSEIQMMFYTHKVNDQRQFLNLLPINTVWMTGAGSLQDISSVTHHPYGAADLPIHTQSCFDLMATEPSLDNWLKAWSELNQAILNQPYTQPTHIALCGDETWTLLELGEKNKWQKLVDWFQTPDWTTLTLETTKL